MNMYLIFCVHTSRSAYLVFSVFTLGQPPYYPFLEIMWFFMLFMFSFNKLTQSE